MVPCVGLRFVLIAAALGVLPLTSEGANVLAVFMSYSPSHLIVHMAHVRVLIERGHNVTVVTSHPIKDRSPLLHHIYIPSSEEATREVEKVKSNMIKPQGMFQFVRNIYNILPTFGRASREAIRDHRIQDLIHNPDYIFDLMILGYFMNDYELGIAAKMKCPIVISFSAPSNILVGRYVGNPAELAYAPASTIFPSGNPLTFIGRLRNLFLFIFTKLFVLYTDLHTGSTYKELFPATEYPPLDDLRQRISLVFCSSHFSEGLVRPNVPALVEVGGIQIKDKPDPLPENLHTVVEAASEHGAIYVSFGSHLGTDVMDSGLIRKLYEVLSGLNQTILWKWNAADRPENATNIHFEQWLPQDDLLAHPNMRLFITHAGKGSVDESQYHGVPMVAIPMFGDQPFNAQKLVDDGFGIKLGHATMTVDNLKAAVLEVLHNPVYRKNVNRFSKLYRDRPMTARETAAYWMEYVIRHKGAYHMQSPLVHLNGLQYLSLDVILFLVLVTFVSFQVLKLLVKVGCRLFRGELCSKRKKVKTT